jgi:hypothetical protein
MQRSDAKVIADHEKSAGIEKALARIVGRRARHRRSPVFNAGVTRPNPKVEKFRAERAAKASKGRAK